MNRFDRVTSLLLLQTRSVVTARFLSDHFGVSERTIYRDIRTLENAGVPIGAEAGVGYFLERGYRLPRSASRSTRPPPCCSGRNCWCRASTPTRCGTSSGR